MVYEEAEKDILIVNDANKGILISTDMIPVKVTRTSGGVTLFSLKKGQKIVYAGADYAEKYENPAKCRKKAIPTTGHLISEIKH